MKNHIKWLPVLFLFILFIIDFILMLMFKNYLKLTFNISNLIKLDEAGLIILVSFFIGLLAGFVPMYIDKKLQEKEKKMKEREAKKVD